MRLLTVSYALPSPVFTSVAVLFFLGLVCVVLLTLTVKSSPVLWIWIKQTNTNSMNLLFEDGIWGGVHVSIPVVLVGLDYYSNTLLAAWSLTFKHFLLNINSEHILDRKYPVFISDHILAPISVVKCYFHHAALPTRPCLFICVVPSTLDVCLCFCMSSAAEQFNISGDKNK